MRLSVKNLVFFFVVVFSCPSRFPSPSSIFRFLIREKETTIGKKDSGEEEEKTTTTREWGIALVHLQDLPLLQLAHHKSREILTLLANRAGRSSSRTSSSEMTTGKLSNLSSSTTLGESSDNGISVEKVFPEGRILEAPNLRVYTFAELRSSTRNFKPESILGEGGFGKVYKGWVEEKTLNPSKSDVGTLVAVKKLNSESVQGLEEWQAEVNFLGRLSHPNLVKILGT
ncbi:probable serine/threonine-protein kinase PIX13 [Zingiber officinale]|uniref:probable serine/threonine-protein kinase PIX13 n=1 Tax=Zingiber officinale TaxID=94328 RepID=UPI001C4B1E93|nr:probable serine/threonine-protein kinase PIX13 [Zingiber officinale]